MKALVVYGTRSGATKAIADEIAKALGEQGYESTVKDVKDSRGIDVNGFDLVVVGSSIWAGMWKREARVFLKKNARALDFKKVALFASGLSGTEPAQKDHSVKTYLEKVAADYPSISPISLGLFGGYMDFNSPNLLIKMVSGNMKADLVKKGVDVTKPYDTRDFAAVRQWALELAAKAKE